MRLAILLLAIAALDGFGQPVCPAINFQQLAQVKLQNRPESIVSGMRRQTDGSFSQIEITGSVTNKTTSLVGIVPDFQQSFFVCSGLVARKPVVTPTPNVGKDPLGTQSRVQIVTDLAGDGTGSIVSLSRRGSNQIAVATANPDYTLRYVGSYAVGPNPQGYVSGDFNGDGIHDVASVYFGPLDGSAPGGISLSLGTGNGTYPLQPVVNYPAGIGTSAAAAWDFNGDGKDDLAVVNMQDGTVTIMLGSATGKLTMGKTYTVAAGSFPTSIVVADINGDGFADIVVAGYQGLVTLLGNGDGTFRIGPSTPLLNAMSFLATGDFNKDGKVDIAFADYQDGFLDIMIGNGDGTFQIAPAQYLIGFNAQPFWVEDFDGDGNLDIVFAGGHPDALITMPYTQTVGVLFGNGDGTFAGAPAYSIGYAYSMVAADFNGDGKPDLAIAGEGSTNILLGGGGSKFRAGTRLNAGGTPAQIATADFNGDAKLDLVVDNAVFLGNGDGTFQPLQTVPGTASDADGVAVGDFNNDHKLDLAVANYSENTVTIATGNGNGTFTAGATLQVGNNPGAIFAADFNRDGNLDLAVVNAGFVFMTNNPGSLSILLGKGDGTFQKAVSYTLPTEFWPNSINSADFNKDGIPDLVLTAALPGFGNTLVVFIGNGDGTFKPGVLYPTDFGPSTVAIADFNGDGHLDLIVPHCCGDTDVTYLLGNGDGTFQPEKIIMYAGANASVVADFNGDGKPDVAFGGSGDAFILLNLSSPVKQQTATIASSANPSAIGVAPGSLASVFGTDLATKVAGATTLPLPATFGGTSVSILDSHGAVTAAPLLYVSPTQVNLEVPPGIAIGAAQVTVTSGDGTQSVANVQVATVAPGLFELNAAGLAAADMILYHADGTNTPELVYTSNSAGAIVATPVSLGSSTDQAFLILFGTGLQAAGTSGVKVSVNGTNLPIQFAGPQCCFTGLDQVNVQLPQSLAGKGNVTIQLTANGLSANPVNITIQ
jgi:uncharacterized protein (TIGR03437 family)